MQRAVPSIQCSSFILILVIVGLAGTLSACGVAYTIVKSESKLDRLAVPMTKAEVVEQIGRPDRVLRDDGRLLVWEYSLTARKQWLYELALCPISVWIGGCIFYPFTNLAAEHQREYPHHIVLVNDELCAWGTPAAILQRRRACASSGTAALGAGGMRGRPEPVVAGAGPINRDTIDRYRTMAVMLFEDAPGVQGSGSRVAGIVTTLLLDLDVNVVERTELDEVFKEQVVQLRDTLVRAHAGGLHPPQHAVDLVNAASSQAAVAPQLNWPAAGRPRMWLATAADSEAHVRGLVARAAVELLTGPDRDRLQVCQAPGCQRVFVSANRRRRWCSATGCGNRVRVARHAARRREEDEPRD